MKSEAVTTVGKLIRSLGLNDTSRSATNTFIKEHGLRVLFLQPYGKGVSQFISMAQAEEVRLHFEQERAKAEEKAKAVKQESLPLVVTDDRDTLNDLWKEIHAIRADIRALSNLITNEVQQLKEASRFFNAHMANISKDTQFLRAELAGAVA